MIFVNDQMKPVLSRNPGMTRTEAMKEIGKIWQERGQSVPSSMNPPEGLDEIIQELDRVVI